MNVTNVAVIRKVRDFPGVIACWKVLIGLPKELEDWRRSSRQNQRWVRCRSRGYHRRSRAVAGLHVPMPETTVGF